MASRTVAPRSRPATNGKREPSSFVGVETFSAQKTIAIACSADLTRDIKVVIRTPGTFNTKEPSVRIEFESGDFDLGGVDVHAADAGALLVALAEAIRVAREDGILPPDQP